MIYLTDEQEEARDQYMTDVEAEHHKKLSKHRGDFHFLVVQALTGEGDYSEKDHGEPPTGTQWE